MSPEDIRRFDFLEAAARVFLQYTTGERQYCIRHRALKWREGEEPNVFLVKYRHSDQCVVAHVTPTQVLFKDRQTSKNLRQFSFVKIDEYLKGRSTVKHRDLMLPRHS